MKRPIVKKALITLGIAAILLIGACVAARYWVHHVAGDRVYSSIADIPESRVAVVLGAKIYPSGNLSALLADRVDAAIDLYKAGKVKKLLMSGDNRVSHYDEPTRMMEYAIKGGIPAQDIAMDYAGRRTYDSVYRAKYIFGLNTFIIVSQGDHVERAIFLCKHLGIDAYGLAADRHDNAKAKLREFPACVSAIIDVCLRHPIPMMGKKEHI